MYALVEFTLNHTVAVIPTNWLSDDDMFCWWPPTKNQDTLKKAVQRRIIPDVERWRSFDIRILKEFETYEKARKKLDKSTVTSDLNTTDEEAPAKRSYNIPTRYLSENESLPQPPIFKKTLPSEYRPSSTTTTASTTTTITTTTTSTTTSTTLTTSTASSMSRPMINVTRTFSTPVDLTDKDKLFFTLLEEIKGQVKQNSLLLQTLVKRRQFESAVIDMDIFNFPLKTKLDMEHVEGLLADRTTEKALINHLCSIGGINADDTIRRMMTTVLNNNLACGYNWKGRGAKHAFSGLALCRAIKAASKKMGITEAESENRIKLWLKYSGDRGGGRTARSQKKTAQLETQETRVCDSSDEDNGITIFNK